ncbi:hypothetical protein [uncultured Desulfobacter sp.]|uniref:hypothetical protein n=1 Tax=uncultured Desulfobacter sp. TaxID=240139 RepID=UPI002AAB31A3|nr:hypothetical protein [uncultured Desulfobacter sp.]
MTDTYGRLAALRPADTAEVQLYAAGSDEQVQGIVSVCNQSSDTVQYSIAHCAAEHGDNAALSADWRNFDVNLEPNEPPHEVSIVLGESETIRVKPSAADSISFIFAGMKML